MGLEVATIFTVLLSHTSRGLVLTVACKLAVKVFGRLQWWLGGDSRLLLASSGAQSCWYPALDFDSGLETHLSCCVARSPVCTHVQPSRVTYVLQAEEALKRLNVEIKGDAEGESSEEQDALPEGACSYMLAVL